MPCYIRSRTSYVFNAENAEDRQTNDREEVQLLEAARMERSCNVYESRDQSGLARRGGNTRGRPTQMALCCGDTIPRAYTPLAEMPQVHQTNDMPQVALSDTLPDVHPSGLVGNQDKVARHGYLLRCLCEILLSEHGRT